MSRTLTVDRRLHRALVGSLTRRHLRSRAGLHLLLVAAVGVAAAAAAGSAAYAVLAAVLVALTLVAGWTVCSVRSLRWGAAPGQEVGVGYAPTGELSVVDATGRLWLPQGSVSRVVPSGPMTGLVGHDLVLALPAGLLGPEDAAFLEGGGVSGAPTAPPLPRLRHSVRVDEGIRADLVAAWTWQALRGPDVLLWGVLAVVFLAASVSTLVQGSLATAVFLAVVALVSLMGSVPHLRRGQESVRTRHPVGAVLRGDLDRQGLSLAGTHTTSSSPWQAYVDLRSDGRTVRLRRRDGAFGGVQVVPAGLFPPAALRQVAERVGGGAA